MKRHILPGLALLSFLSGLVALAAGFKVQNQINKAFINQKVAAIYGSNRTMDIALDALLPMI